MEIEATDNNAEKLAVEWIESNLGGRVVASHSQGRWRNAWFFKLEKNGEILPLYFRGHRPGLGKDTRRLKFELKVYEILKKYNLPVPEVYGFCPAPEGIVMEHCPGRANLATADSKQEQEAVLDQYIDALAAMHKIPLEAFESLSLPCPTTSEERGLADMAYWEKAFRQQKSRLGERAKPEPLIEFVLLWLKANVPENRDSTVFLHVDSGQFIFEKNRLTAMLDFELAMLGDPAADLAGLRTRDLSEPLGDLRRAFARYEKITAKKIDSNAVDFHTVRFAMMTPLPIAALCACPPTGVNLPQYLGWYYTYSRVSIALIAKKQGITLTEPLLPTSSLLANEHQPVYSALRNQIELLKKFPEGDEIQYQLDIAFRTAVYLQRINDFSAVLEKDNLDDLSVILERPIASMKQGLLLLESMVIEKGLSLSSMLVPFFYRYCQRHLFLLGPCLRELEGARLQPLS
ncbi:MAG: phosphotransferase family protein [Pseudomonadales bacterium]|nr:phosphotransferase family protein [Pseudomonadales bacterium]